MSNTVPNGILANQFWIDAKAYVDAAKILVDDETVNRSQPTYFLLSHALELLLKSYLLAKGLHLDQLEKKIGHNLVEAHARARDFGLRVEGEHTQALIERLSEFHNALIFRYPVLTKDERRLVLRGHLVRADEIYEVVASICSQVHGTVIRARLHASSAGELPIETWHMGFPEKDT